MEFSQRFSCTKFKDKLSELVRAEKGSSSYGRLFDLLKDEVVVQSCIHLDGDSDSKDEARVLLEIVRDADVSRLKKLYLPGNSLDERMIEDLSGYLRAGRFSILTHLDLYRNANNVGMDSSIRMAEALKTGYLSGLRHLSLPPCHVPTIAESLRLGGISKLEHVSLEGNRDLEQRSGEIRKLLEGGLFSGVDHISLRNCSVDAGTMEALAKALMSDSISKLKHLDLSWNPIRDKGSEAIARLWQSRCLSSLEHLSLCRCEIRDGGMKVISKAIVEGTVSKLQVLNVQENTIGDVGVSDLLEALKCGHLLELRTLIVALNWIQEGGMLALADFLSERRYVGELKELYLLEMLVSEKVQKAFVSAYANNDALTVELVGFRWPNKAHEANAAKHRRRNLTQTCARNNLEGEKNVPATTGKVFFCGFQEVGKTTLRKSLQQTRVGAIYSSLWSTTEPRTRGIEVSHVQKKRWGVSTKLAIWDLAGQAEYRVLQSAFCLAEGKATIFVIVCNANYQGLKSENELSYWLRFVASSCEQGIQRHVLVVLNCFDEQDPSGVLTLWELLMQRQRVKYQDLLYIHQTPFVLDARRRKSVNGLKKHLMDLTEELLKDQFMPQICQEILRRFDKWIKKDQNFPVLRLDEFLSKFNESRTDQDERKLVAALEFLHEAGEVVFFNKGRMKFCEAVTDLVVLDSNWFCQRVVGHLLLPDSMLGQGESSLKSIAAPDGTISLEELHAFFKPNLGNTKQVELVVPMLMSLGLCYKVGEKKVLVPALIVERDDMDKWEECGVKDGNAGHWVMGRSLTLMDCEKTALPAALFRLLQVELAQDPKSVSYMACKSSSNFKYQNMIVLVQFDVSEKDPVERIDILVKPLVGNGCPDDVRKQQLDLIEEIMDKLEPISIRSCPGVQFHRMSIIPWNAAKPTLPMKARKLVSLDEYKKRVEHCGLDVPTNECVDDASVRYDDLLSSGDLVGLKKTIQCRLEGLDTYAAQLGIDPREADQDEDEDFSAGESDHLSKEAGQILNEVQKQGSITRTEVRNQGRLTRRVMERGIAELHKTMEELHRSIGSIFHNQNRLLKKIHAFQSYTISEKESSLPRFMYMTKCKDPSSWITVKEAFSSSFQLHLLCEARSDGDHLHEVVGQVGVTINNPHKWVRRLQPWLEWSLGIAIVVARVVGAATLPGLGLLLPNPLWSEGSNIATLVESLAGLGAEVVDGSENNSVTGTSSQVPMDLKVRATAAVVLKQIIKETGEVDFWQKMGLRKVVLMDKNSTPTKCAWICESCYKCYNNKGLVADITP